MTNTTAAPGLGAWETIRAALSGVERDYTTGPVGQAVGLIDQIRPARDIVADMVREAEAVIANQFASRG